MKLTVNGISLPSEWCVRMVACGYRHTALVTTCGLLLTCGHGETGRLGHGELGSQSLMTRHPPTKNCGPPPTAHCPPPTAHRPPPTAHRPPLTAHHPPSTIHRIARACSPPPTLTWAQWAQWAQWAPHMGARRRQGSRRHLRATTCHTLGRLEGLQGVRWRSNRPTATRMVRPRTPTTTSRS